ncbi:hypothetical protein GCM10012320_08310 [Sinomonas cellulolyticus]|uniref:Uncharacterized protein n=1 Tax=Sinomonas cellulolyticus TaxID=2801916 RepID=A0ABS1K4B1_9MICC|nr:MULTISPECIES: prenyltransferase/squalene oxidase repeat-containing protein [Sinomonas]MBL0706293.1 hypothetical protein [Sinomonas cellulolyticus]GHG43896.1 hypothetical protein GCM10012320_08310 [Sinomonas sp. KCTC 49339]
MLTKKALNPNPPYRDRFVGLVLKYLGEQNPDGGWGKHPHSPSTIRHTAQAMWLLRIGLRDFRLRRGTRRQVDSALSYGVHYLDEHLWRQFAPLSEGGQGALTRTLIWAILGFAAHPKLAESQAAIARCVKSLRASVTRDGLPVRAADTESALYETALAVRVLAAAALALSETHDVSRNTIRPATIDDSVRLLEHCINGLFVSRLGGESVWSKSIDSSAPSPGMSAVCLISLEEARHTLDAMAPDHPLLLRLPDGIASGVRWLRALAQEQSPLLEADFENSIGPNSVRGLLHTIAVVPNALLIRISDDDSVPPDPNSATIHPLWERLESRWMVGASRKQGAWCRVEGGEKEFHASWTFHTALTYVRGFRNLHDRADIPDLEPTTVPTAPEVTAFELANAARTLSIRFSNHRNHTVHRLSEQVLHVLEALARGPRHGLKRHELAERTGIAWANIPRAISRVREVLARWGGATARALIRHTGERESLTYMLALSASCTVIVDGMTIG